MHDFCIILERNKDYLLTKVLLKLNVKKAALTKVTRLLPSLHAPTINGLASKGWFAVETVVDETAVRNLIPQLKTAGAQGIIEIPLNKLVP